MAAALVPSLTSPLQLARRPHARLSPPHITLSTNSAIWHHRLGSTLQRTISLKPLCFSGSTNSAESQYESPSLSTMIRQFYACINDKEDAHGEVNNFIADDCFFEDLAFPRPFEGRKAVYCFLRDLREAMGKHVTFAIEEVCEGEESTVAVVWHLEWNEERIPFTKGCSIFECSRNGQRVLINKACIFVESPVKAGDFVLELLKFISSLFDKFPGLTEKLLKQPYIIMQFIVKIYKIFVEPFVLPLLVYYTHIWTFSARLLSFFLGLVQNLLKIFM